MYVSYDCSYVCFIFVTSYHITRSVAGRLINAVCIGYEVNALCASADKNLKIDVLYPLDLEIII